MSRIETDTKRSVREVLADYDRRVRQAFTEVAETTTGTKRVQSLHILDRVMSTHDSVVATTLCPLLQGLPGGPEVAERLRRGCAQRAELLARFHALSEGTEARNVYPVFGTEVERIIIELKQSFDQHVQDETIRVGELLESAGARLAPEVLATQMAMQERRAPARAHRATYRYPNSRTLRALYRSIDRMHDWNDSHHGWLAETPRVSQGVRPPRKFSRRPPSIPDLLASYDQTVEALIVELDRSGAEDPRRASAAYRLAAAIAVHDSIVGGTLCRLLDAVPEGRPTATVLRHGCEERAHLLEQWDDLIKRGTPWDLIETHSVEANSVMDRLIASFRVHESHETNDVSGVVEQLRQRTWKSSGSGLVSPYLLEDWPNPEPGVLAAHMALWADKAPTHTHPLLTKHPTNRLLRNLYRHADNLRDWRRSQHGWPRLTRVDSGS